MSTESTAVAIRADSAPEVWDRQGDSVVAFGQHMDLRWKIAEGIAKSGMTHHTKPEAVMTIALTAFEMGLPLMQALRGMYVVQGKIAIEGHLMDALAIQRCGVSKTKVRSDNEACELILHRAGWADLAVSYTLEDAIRAGCISGVKDGRVVPYPKRETWAKHTRNMLYWRALSEGLRQIAPDYFGGVYHPDELQEAVAIGQSTARVSTNAELDALKNGVEPDPDVLSDDEQEQLGRELDAAEKSGAIDNVRRVQVARLVIDGRWKEAREAWEEVRALVLEAEAEAA